MTQILRLSVAATVGAFGGAAVTGLLALATGHADTTALKGLPFIALIGAALGCIAAFFARRWLLPAVTGRRRYAVFAALGAVVVSLMTFAPGLGGVLAPAILLGGAAAVVYYVTVARRPAVRR
ncbi:hypothetical protein MOQ72_34250 [Saccharopolyspora sp. K220]|uniref:hypothetical protein n=1 Tax=Saccharopolyspora soli TaxID=2926618 RepID=UPI001F56E4CA|nr:hypothetical protein [Saccharopolyspora soli]MCI2422502.1 hypothetical protein [Saccharopolyspora soli]